jgi:hypothetical protein
VHVVILPLVPEEGRNQCQSVSIRVNQCQSVVIRGNQRSSPPSRTQSYSTCAGSGPDRRRRP